MYGGRGGDVTYCFKMYALQCGAAFVPVTRTETESGGFNSFSRNATRPN